MREQVHADAVGELDFCRDSGLKAGAYQSSLDRGPRVASARIVHLCKNRSTELSWGASAKAERITSFSPRPSTTASRPASDCPCLPDKGTACWPWRPSVLVAAIDRTLSRIGPGAAASSMQARKLACVVVRLQLIAFDSRSIRCDYPSHLAGLAQ